MRTTLNIDDELLLEAQKITRIKEKRQSCMPASRRSSSAKPPVAWPKAAAAIRPPPPARDAAAHRPLNDPGRQLGLDQPSAQGRSATGGLLLRQQIVIHTMVLAELACGSLEDRERVLLLWRRLPRQGAVSDATAMQFLNAIG